MEMKVKVDASGKRGIHRKLTYEDRFDRDYACWANNHGGWSKAKTQTRREFRAKLKEEPKKEILKIEDEVGDLE